jgi:AmpE protein
MALSLLVIAIVLLGAAAAPDLVRLRRFDWWGRWLVWLDAKLAPNGFWRDPVTAPRIDLTQHAEPTAWLALAIAIGLPVVLLACLSYWLNGIFYGVFGFALSLVALYYCLGPRDLGDDVTELSHAFQPARRLNAQRAFGLTDGVLRGTTALIELVLTAALQRHFAPIFWYASFGPAGALAYRLTQLAARSSARGSLTQSDNVPSAIASAELPELQNTELSALPNKFISTCARLEAAMAWIPAQLMCAALALASDFDAVARAWREHHERHGRGIFDLDLGFLASTVKACIDIDDVDELTDATVPLDNAPLQHTQALLGRITLTWLVAIALLVLAFYIA